MNRKLSDDKSVSKYTCVTKYSDYVSVEILVAYFNPLQVCWESLIRPIPKYRFRGYTLYQNDIGRLPGEIQRTIRDEVDEIRKNHKECYT